MLVKWDVTWSRFIMHLWSLLLYTVPAIRAFSFGLFLLSTFSVAVSWTSAISLIVFIASVYGLGANEHQKNQEQLNKPLPNPLKGKPKIKHLSQKRNSDVNKVVNTWLLDHDPEHCLTLERFEPIKLGTECIFAQKARIWGSMDWDPQLSLEENVFRSVPMFYKFTLVCQELGLDGFVYMLPGHLYGGNLQDLGKAVRGLLVVLSNLDPQGGRCMGKSYLDKPGWAFEFNRHTFFVTTFSPIYPPSSSRFAHGARDCFLLLQPEVSFAQHNLPPDTPHTEWDHPVTVRDQIRGRFKSAGRGYRVSETLRCPMVYEIVKPLADDEPVIEWWQTEKL